MATIAELSVVLGLDKRGFDRGMKDAVLNARQLRTSFLTATAAVAATGAALVELAERGGKVLNVTEAFDRQNVSLAELRSATMGLVSDYDLMVQANTALTLGSARTGEEFATLARTAQGLGRALGLDVGFALNSLNIGIARQSRLVLDNLGLIVDVTQANEKYAASIGVSVDQLTDAQKAEAFRTEAMTQARIKLDQMGESSRTAGDAITSLKVALGNAADEAAVLVTQSDDLRDFFDDMARHVRIATHELTKFNDERERQARQTALFFGTEQMPVQTTQTGSLAGTVRDAGAQHEAWKLEVDQLGEALRGRREEIAKNIEADRIFAQAMRELSESIVQIRVDALNPLTGQLLDFGDATHLLGSDWIPELDTSLSDASVTLLWYRQKMEEMNAETQRAISLTAQLAGVLGGVSGLASLFGFNVPFFGKAFQALGVFNSFDRAGMFSPGEPTAFRAEAPVVVNINGPGLEQLVSSVTVEQGRAFTHRRVARI